MSQRPAGLSGGFSGLPDPLCVGVSPSSATHILSGPIPWVNECRYGYSAATILSHQTVYNKEACIHPKTFIKAKGGEVHGTHLDSNAYEYFIVTGASDVSYG